MSIKTHEYRCIANEGDYLQVEQYPNDPNLGVIVAQDKDVCEVLLSRDDVKELHTVLGKMLTH